MKRFIAIATLLLPTAASAQPRTTLEYIAPSQAEQEMQAEQAKHPDEHWVCTGADWYCLEGYWERNQDARERNEWVMRGDLSAMRAADERAGDAARAAVVAAPYRAAAEFPSELESALVKAPVFVMNATSISISAVSATPQTVSISLPDLAQKTFCP